MGPFGAEGAGGGVFDPLLPRCRFDPSHAMALDRLRRHELTCPANPRRHRGPPAAQRHPVLQDCFVLPVATAAA